MEKAGTVIGQAVVGNASRDQAARREGVDHRDHLKVWREIYQDVRRQWAEAESMRPRGPSTRRGQ